MKSTTHPVSGTVTLNGQRVAYTATVKSLDGYYWVSDHYLTLPPNVWLSNTDHDELVSLIKEDAIYTATH